MEVGLQAKVEVSETVHVCALMGVETPRADVQFTDRPCHPTDSTNTCVYAQAQRSISA